MKLDSVSPACVFANPTFSRCYSRGRSFTDSIDDRVLGPQPAAGERTTCRSRSHRSYAWARAGALNFRRSICRSSKSPPKKTFARGTKNTWWCWFVVLVDKLQFSKRSQRASSNSLGTSAFSLRQPNNDISSRAPSRSSKQVVHLDGAHPNQLACAVLP